MKRLTWLLTPLLVAALAAPAAANPGPGSVAPYVSAHQQVTPVAQGLMVTSFQRLYPHGGWKSWPLMADLSEPTLRSDVLTAPALTEREPLSAMAARAGAVAAVNGDFFAMAGTGIALGTVVQNGQYLQSPLPNWPNGVLVGKDRIGRLASVVLEGTVTTPDGSYPLAVVNTPVVPEGAIGIFTSLWTIDRPWAMGDAAVGCEVVVRQGRVVSISPKVSGDPVPADGFILVGTGDMAAPLARLNVGDPVSVSYRAVPDVWWALGGQNVLVDDGSVVDGLDGTSRRPRTAIGFSKDGSRMYLLAIDGDSSLSRGLSLREVAELMREFGAHSALELDGGGSTTMVARLPGTSGLTVINRPADGAERRIPNGVGLFAEPGSGVAHWLQVEGEPRVFPGLSRTLTVTALDEQYEAAPVETPAWSLAGPGTITADGRYTAAGADGAPVPAGASAVVTVEAEGLTAEARIRVLGRLAGLTTSAAGGLRLTAAEGAFFTVIGHDADGYRATIDPDDLEISYDSSLVRVEREGDGLRAFPVAPGTGLIRVAVQGRETFIPFVSGHATTVLSALSDPALWEFARYPDEVGGAVAPGDIPANGNGVNGADEGGHANGAAGTGGAGGPAGAAMALQYHFGPASSNRAAYLQAAAPVVLPGQPDRFGLWVKGDGQGAWLRAVLKDAAGGSYTVDLARKVDWTGWRYVEARIPDGVAYPVSLYRVYPVETDTTRIYSGVLQFADLTVSEALAMPEVPEPAEAPDVILAPGNAAGEGSWSFAVLGQMPEVEPQPVVATALAADPAFFLVNAGLGEVVRQALTDLGRSDVPVYEMVPPARYFDAGGVRFILLGTEQGGLRATEFGQLPGLQTLLSLTARDQAIRQVVVVGGEAPPAWADGREAELVQRWLTEFEEESGKAAAYLSAGGAFPDVHRLEGIPYIEVGSPMVPRIFKIDPTPGRVWIRLER